MHGVHLDDAQMKQLKFEVIPTEAKTYLTRYLRPLPPRCEDHQYSQLFTWNDLINRTRTLTGDRIYVLECDDFGDYRPEELVWHRSEYEVAIRRLDSCQFIEFLAELVRDEVITFSFANDVLEKANSSARLLRSNSGDISVELLWDEQDFPDDSPKNIRTLVSRMERDLGAADYGGVLHASASIFEWLAKDLLQVSNPGVLDQTLNSFFDCYRNRSALPDAILDYIREIYIRRNTEPLAGHGKLDEPSINHEEASLLTEMTKAFVKHEQRMALTVSA